MFKEIAYWVYHFFMTVKKDTDRMDAILFTSLCLFLNVLSIICAVEHYLNFKILDRLPELDRWQFSSWVLAALFTFPFVWSVYNRYFTTPKLQGILEEYARKSKSRLLYGRIFVCSYCVLTWTIFFIAVTYLND